MIDSGGKGGGGVSGGEWCDEGGSSVGLTL